VLVLLVSALLVVGCNGSRASGTQKDASGAAGGSAATPGGNTGAGGQTASGGSTGGTPAGGAGGGSTSTGGVVVTGGGGASGAGTGQDAGPLAGNTPAGGTTGSGGNSSSAGTGGAGGTGTGTTRTGGSVVTGGTGTGGTVATGGASTGGTGTGGTSAGGAGGTAACAVTPAVRTLLSDVETRLTFLTTNTADWWLSHGVDATNGGFYGTLNAQGTSVAPRDKGLIQQSRHLWTFSKYYERRGALPAAKAAADSTYQFIVSHMRDASDGEFYFKVNETGTTIVDSKKLLYAEGFAVYALAEYGRIFNVQAAKDYALTCFRHMDARAHDATYKGYDQRNDAAGWLSAGVEKETNTHIHLMESFTALYEATGDATVGLRLNELIDVVDTKLLQPTNYVAQNFKVNWAPTGSVFVSYGHDIETTWLVLDAARAAGRSTDPGVLAAALAMGKHSSERGLNATTGGYNYEGVPNSTTVNNTEHIWWVEFESLSGNYWLYRLTCDPIYLTRLESTLKWIEARRDPTGEWYWGNLPNGSIGPHGTNKSDEWKASYHNLRALMFAGDWVHGTLN
jgi:mannobiose 2-epimerase